MHSISLNATAFTMAWTVRYHADPSVPTVSGITESAGVVVEEDDDPAEDDQFAAETNRSTQ